MGLIALGLQPGERAAILSENNKEWLFCDLGALCAAGVSTGIYPTDSPAQVEYLVNDCDAKFLFVEDEEQLDKILAVRERTPGLREDHRVRHGGPARLRRSAGDVARRALRARARRMRASIPELWEERIAAAEARRRGHHRLHLGHHRPLQGRDAHPPQHHLPDRRPSSASACRSSETDEALNFLPLCHVAERFGGCYNHIAAMHIVNFAEAPDTVPQNLREVAPHIFLAVPRVWEKLYSAVTIQIKEGTALGRARLQGRDRARLQGERLRDRGQAGAGARCARLARLATGWCSRTSA